MKKFLVVGLIFLMGLMFLGMNGYAGEKQNHSFFLELGMGAIVNIKSLYPEEPVTPRVFICVGPAFQVKKFSISLVLNQYASTGNPGNSFQSLDLGCNYNLKKFYFGMSHGTILKDHKQTGVGYISYKIGMKLFTTADQIGAWLEIGLKRNTGYIALGWNVGLL